MRRWWFGALLMAAPVTLAAPAQARPSAPIAQAALPSAEQVLLPAADKRQVDGSLWLARKSRGIVLFGHGFGSNPAAYQRIVGAMWAAGYSVAAPLSLDSFAGPFKGQVDPRRAFAARVEDLAIVRGYVARRFARQPVVLAGHSFGSLVAMIGAGAMTPAGVQPGPPIAGAIAFSTAGSVPGLISADSFAPIAAPMLIVTGDADTVPGFVTDWRDHRRAFDQSRASHKTLLIVRGGTHDLVGKGSDAAFAPVARATIDFLNAFAGKDRAAARRLAALRSTPTLTVEQR